MSFISCIFNASVSLLQLLQPTCDGLPNFIRRILLRRMVPAHAHLGLRRPRAIERDLVWVLCSRNGLDEQFGNATLRKPLARGCDDLTHIGWFALDRQLTCPREV